MFLIHKQFSNAESHICGCQKSWWQSLCRYKFNILHYIWSLLDISFAKCILHYHTKKSQPQLGHRQYQFLIMNAADKNFRSNWRAPLMHRSTIWFAGCQLYWNVFDYLKFFWDFEVSHLFDYSYVPFYICWPFCGFSYPKFSRCLMPCFHFSYLYPLLFRFELLSALCLVLSVGEMHRDCNRRMYSFYVYLANHAPVFTKTPESASILHAFEHSHVLPFKKHLQQLWFFS